MLCRKHHQMEEAGKLLVFMQTKRGCDGAVMFQVKP
jgi:hypothetical protein